MGPTDPQLRALIRRPQPNIAFPVLRSLIAIAGVHPEQLAREINHLLSLDDPSDAVFDLHRIVKSIGAPDWSEVADLQLDEVSLVPGLLHDSDLIGGTAALLLQHGCGGANISAALKNALARANGHTLRNVIFVATKVWGNEAIFILMERFKAGPQDGAEAICAVVADLVDSSSLDQAKSFLFEALQSPFPLVVDAAAKGLLKLERPPTTDYIEQLKAVFLRWKDTEFKCDSCGVTCTKGFCPNCRIVPYTPYAALVRELARAGGLTLDELVEHAKSDWSEISRTSSEEVAKIVASDSSCLVKIVEQLKFGLAPVGVLDAILRLPEPIVSGLWTRLLPLAQSSDAKVRARFFEGLPTFSREAATCKELAQSALADEQPVIRSAAAKALRALNKVETK